MIIPSYGLTATERVLPSFTLDWTTGLVQSTVDVTRAGVATFIGSNGAVQSASADTQRIDYRTGVSGLLVEESRTNLLPYSIPDAAVPTGYTVSVASGTYSHTLVDGSGALLGFQQMVKHEQTVDGRSALNLVLGLSASTTYTLSIYVDTANSAITSGNANILIVNGYSDATGTLGATLANADANGRIAITFTTGADTSGNIRFGIGCSGNATGILYMGGWQLEVGAFPTSYIPTEASAVTRNADVATMTGTNFSDWYNPTEGTFAITAWPAPLPDLGVSTTGALLCAASLGNSLTAQVSLLFRTEASTRANRGAMYVRDSVSATWVETLANETYPNNTYTKGVAALKSNDLAFASNGSAVATSAVQALPTITQMNIGKNYGTSFLNGWVKEILYYPQRLTNAEIQAFSKG